MKSRKIDVYLISGFLGAGKTTFLNRMLKHAPADRKLMILMNEFGEEGIDGALVEDPDLELLEISRGSIFCACVKGDYIKGLYRIATVIKPDILVMEATGVANPADLGRDIANPVFKGAFKLVDKFCIVDAANFLEQFDVFASLEAQIVSTDAFIVNKVDLAARKIVDRVKETILRHNANAKFVETTFAEFDFRDVFRADESAIPRPATGPEPTERLLTPEELDEVVDQILDDQAGHVAPPDRLASMACRWLSGRIDNFRGVASNLPSDVVRAKGLLFESGIPYLYNHVGKRHEIVPFHGPKLANNFMNRVVFIRREFREDDIRSLFSDRGINLL